MASVLMKALVTAMKDADALVAFDEGSVIDYPIAWFYKLAPRGYLCDRISLSWHTLLNCAERCADEASRAATYVRRYYRLGIRVCPRPKGPPNLADFIPKEDTSKWSRILEDYMGGQLNIVIDSWAHPPGTPSLGDLSLPGDLVVSGHFHSNTAVTARVSRVLGDVHIMDMDHEWVRIPATPTSKAGMVLYEVPRSVVRSRTWDAGARAQQEEYLRIREAKRGSTVSNRKEWEDKF